MHSRDQTSSTQVADGDFLTSRIVFDPLHCTSRGRLPDHTYSLRSTALSHSESWCNKFLTLGFWVWTESGFRVFQESMFSFLLVAGSFCSLRRGDKEDHRMEMWWCLIALKPLCHFLLFGMYVMLLDARWLCGKGVVKWSALGGNLVVQRHKDV
jgi:hypothetical protein